MSRAKNHVIVLFHENDWVLFDELYKYTGMDVVLDKLSKSKLLGEHDLKSIDSQLKMMQAIKLIVVSRHLQQFKAVLSLMRNFKDANFHHCVQKLLASCFTWCKKGNILEMLHLFQSETNTGMTQEDAWKYLMESSFFVAEDWEQNSRKKMLDKFQEVTQVSFKNFEIELGDYNHQQVFPPLWIAESEDLLQSFRNSVTIDVLFVFIVNMGQYHFNENSFRKIITILFGERAISIDVEKATRCLFLIQIPLEDNFRTIMDLIENDVVKIFTESYGGMVKVPLIFHYFRISSFDIFKGIFARIRQTKIRFSELLDDQKTNILWYIARGDCGIHKTSHVLQDACEQNNDELERLLTQKDFQGLSVLHYHCAFSNDPRIVQLLIKYSRTIWNKIIAERGETLIHLACYNNQIALLDFLLKLDENNYEVTRRADKKGETCLHYACKNGKTTIVKMLQNTVPSLASKRDNSGKKALHIACFNGHLDTAQTLCRHYCGEGFFKFMHDLNKEKNNSFPLASQSKKTVEETSNQEILLNMSKFEQRAK